MSHEKKTCHTGRVLGPLEEIKVMSTPHPPSEFKHPVRALPVNFWNYAKVSNNPGFILQFSVELLKFISPPEPPCSAGVNLAFGVNAYAGIPCV
jgi:hypothetical protein